MDMNDIFVPANPEDLAEEQSNFLSILAAFKHYRAYSMSRVDKTEGYLNSLSDSHQDMLIHYRHHLNKIRNCIDENSQIIRRIIQHVDRLFDNENQTIVTPLPGKLDRLSRVRAADLDKVQVTLKQFVRDWSEDGEEERQQCYKPIIDAVMVHFDPSRRDVSGVKVLVPGAGLGRLTYEFARRGYYCEGNEFSLFMLIASNFVLNKCPIANQYTIYPWVHQNVNNVRRQDQVRASSFPDVSPMQAPPKGAFNMVAGDFLQVYRQPNSWDCVATCFFIDCANNVADFVETIFNILRPGGIWVNLGPLLYHYSDLQFEGSIEPTYEDLVEVIRMMGFEILRNETNLRTKYAQNPRSMQQSEYMSAFFVCRKPLDDCPVAMAQQRQTRENLHMEAAQPAQPHPTTESPMKVEHIGFCNGVEMTAKSELTIKSPKDEPQPGPSTCSE